MILKYCAHRVGPLQWSQPKEHALARGSLQSSRTTNAAGSRIRLHALVRKSLKPIYIPDAEFADAFSSLQMKNRGTAGKRLRYFLATDRTSIEWDRHQ
jgi:hypothetical protein